MKVPYEGMYMTAVVDNRLPAETAADESTRTGSVNAGRSPVDHLAKIALGFGIAVTLAWTAFLGWSLNSILNLI
jgi:hypothetical protein